MKPLFFLLIMLAAMAGAQSCNNKTESAVEIYDCLKTASLEPQWMEIAPNGDGVFYWNQQDIEDPGSMYFNIKQTLVKHFAAKPQETEYIYPGMKHSQEECWIVNNRRIILTEDTARAVKLTIIVI